MRTQPPIGSFLDSEEVFKCCLVGSFSLSGNMTSATKLRLMNRIANPTLARDISSAVMSGICYVWVSAMLQRRSQVWKDSPNVHLGG